MRQLVLLLALATTGCANTERIQPDGPAGDQPNFLIIVGDDMGYTDLGAFGGQDIATPNLDRLALAGIRFSNFHGHLSCAPSRAMLMTGTGNHEAGLGTQRDIPVFRGQRNYERHLVNRVVTLQEVLQANGYRTYLAGKWGLSGPSDLDPFDRGFNRSFALVPSGGGHYQPIYHDLRYTLDGKPFDEPDPAIFSTTLFTDQLIDFFEEDADSKQPFLAWFAPTAPHWPLHFPPEFRDAYNGRYDGGYDLLRRERIEGGLRAGVLPGNPNTLGMVHTGIAWDSLTHEQKALQARIMEIHAAMTAHLDAEIGRLLDRMKDTGALENTVVLFVNDNGAQGGPNIGGPPSYAEGRTFNNELSNIGNGDSWANLGHAWASAATLPYRANKGTVYEGGIRVPAFMHWFGKRLQPSVYREYLQNMDVMPTLLQLADIVHPASEFDGQAVMPMRGKSFAAVVDGSSMPIHPPDEAIALSSAGRHFLQRGKWKLLKELDTDWELYDLEADPYEHTNLADSLPELLVELRTEFKRQANRSNILDR